MEERRYLTDREKEIVGLKCANCNSIEELQYHHIIPLALGGTNKLTNLVCLCNKCHSLIHQGNNRQYINHSTLVKKGLERAKAEGKQIGIIKGTNLTTKKSIECKEKIKKYNIDFDGKLNNIETIKLLGIARGTFYKYKKELKEEKNNDIS